MTLIVKPQPVPLREDPVGAWRIGNSRVLLDLADELWSGIKKYQVFRGRLLACRYPG